MNDYGERFFKLLDKYKAQNIDLLKEEKISDFICYRDDFPSELLIECSNMAGDKAKKVSKKNQKGEIRTDEAVKTNVFKGIIAETVTHLFLLQVCDFSKEEVHRYDLERVSFDYDPKQEYDVALFKDGTFACEIGVKASKIERSELDSFLNKQHCIIAKYRYAGRLEDHNSAFYMGIIIVYNYKYDEESFIEQYSKGMINTYIVSGATLSEMNGELNTNNIKMNQGKTRYNLGLQSLYAGDARDARKKIIDYYNGRNTIDYEYSKDSIKRLNAYALLFDKYGIYHANRNCKYIKDRKDLKGYFSVDEAVKEGHFKPCQYCTNTTER